MVTAKQLANDFSYIDLEPWIEEIENRIANVTYPSKADVELLPKLKEALKIVNNAPTLPEEEYEALCFDAWSEKHERNFM